MQTDFSDASILHYYHYIHRNEYAFPGHRHLHLELNVILDGEMEISCDDSVFALSAGDCIIIPASVFHRNRVLGTKSAEMLVLHFLTPESWIFTQPQTAKMTSTEKAVLSLFIQDIEGETPKLNTMLSHALPTARKLFEVFLSYLCALPVEKSTARHSHAKTYATAVRFMEANLDTRLRLSNVARHTGVCTTTLEEIFSQYTGMGCMDFFEDLRLNAAMKLLENGFSCGEVSRKAGFSSQAYFSARFRLKYGILPSKIKKTLPAKIAPHERTWK